MEISAGDLRERDIIHDRNPRQIHPIVPIANDRLFGLSVRMSSYSMGNNSGWSWEGGGRKI